MNCPKCGDFMDADEYFDVEMEDSYNLVAKVMGCCIHCRKVYYWDEIFTFKEEKNLRETY